MSASLKIGVGLLSLIAGAGLIYVFSPSLAPAGTAQRSAVVQPQFVAKDVTPHAVDVASEPSPSPAQEADLAKLATALKAAAPTPSAAPTVSEDVKRNCAEGLIAFANGDVAGARALLERAADGGEPKALMVLAQTYDPKMLEQFGIVGAKGDSTIARSYYARALAAGLTAAKPHLATLNVGALTTTAANGPN